VAAPLAAVEPGFREDQLAGRGIQWHAVSSVTCQLTLRVTGCNRRSVVSTKESDFTPIASRSLQFGVVSVRPREWNCSCSNWA
jgi:hypothetical protein